MLKKKEIYPDNVNQLKVNHRNMFQNHNFLENLQISEK